MGVEERRPIRDAFWALDRELTDGDRERMLADILLGCPGETEGEVVCWIGRAAHCEGKSFDESLNAYFILYGWHRNHPPKKGRPTRG